MTPAVETPVVTRFPWAMIAWFGALLAISYAPIVGALIHQWDADPDMSHGFFVPAISAFMIWQRRHELMAIKTRPDWRGLALVLYGTAQLYLATLGAELFLARTALVITIFGAVWMLGGMLMLRKLFFPLFLLFFMVPIPAVIYNRITFPLQLLASRLAGDALSVMGLPVLREGNILELPEQRLSVVEACSGIRSLLTLTFLSLVFGHFFEKKTWIRVVLFLSTVPIAIVANASRVTLTGLLTEWKPEFAEGFFHTAQGWVIFMVSLFILILFHQVLTRVARRWPSGREAV
ncbi:MAG TPA: exosortase [Bryobacteraceae bacterium]|jgi:exosortase|nr:exosortase [Bryobacteraceae bacterium]